MESVNCNLCNHPTAAIVFELTDLLLEREDVRTTLVKCQRCGLVYQNPRPTLAEIGVHYPPDYESYNPEPDQKMKSRLLERAVQHGINKRCRFVTRRKSGGRLLDVGCATGVFLRGMANNPGWELHGVELSSHAARIARDQFGLDVFTGTLEAASFPDHYFDVVTMWDVLEHLHDPTGSMCEIHRILKPDGIIVMRVPNGSSWDARLFGRYWAGLDAPRHLFVFDLKTLPSLLDKSGFRAESMSCGIGGYPTFVLSLRLWLYAKGFQLETRQAAAKLLYHPIARIISAPIFYLTSLTLRGPLVTVTASSQPAPVKVSDHA
jgi:SAM-dependent methyltransferase